VPKEINLKVVKTKDQQETEFSHAECKKKKKERPLSSDLRQGLPVYVSKENAQKRKATDVFIKGGGRNPRRK